MLNRVILTVLTITLVASGVSGEVVEVNGNNSNGECLTVTVLESNPGRTVIRYEISAFEQEAVSIDGSEYHLLRLPNTTNCMAAGYPDLPIISRNIVLSRSGEPYLNVLAADYVEYSDMPIAPAKGPIQIGINPNDIAYSFNEIYSSPECYPKTLFEISEPFYIRDCRGITVRCQPFRYCPATATLRVYTSVTVEIVSNDENIPQHLSGFEHKRRTAAFEATYRRLFINYNPQPSGLLRIASEIEESDMPEMLIIAYDDFADEMSEFVDWKNQKGINTSLITLTELSPGADTATSVKSYIQALYEDPTHDLVYVLLVGDDNELPPYMFYVNGTAYPSDYWYSLMPNGEEIDPYADLVVGRFSAQTGDDVLTQVRRSIDYEKNPLSGDWLHKGSGLAYSEDADHISYLRTVLLDGGQSAGPLSTYTIVDEFYNRELLQLRTEFIDTINNAGRSIVNYCGHGTYDKWQAIDVWANDFTDNQNELPFIFSVACLCGNFEHVDECFGEELLRKRDQAENPLGAVAVYMSSSEQYNSQRLAQTAFCNGLVDADRQNSFGSLCYSGAAVMLGLHSDSSNGIKHALGWVVFGDPSLQVRTDSVRSIVVEHYGQLSHMTELYRLTVTMSGEPVSDARCALYGDGILYGSKFTDEEGKATINVTDEIMTDEPLTLTITGFNLATVQEDVLVLPIVIYCDSLPDSTNNCNQNVRDTAGYYVDCEVFSDSAFAVDNPVVEYSTNQGDTWLSVSLNQKVGGYDYEYEGFIPLQDAGADVLYKYSAEDYIGRSFSSEPDSFHVIDYAVSLQLNDEDIKSEIYTETVDFIVTLSNNGGLEDVYDITSDGTLGWPAVLLSMDNIEIPSSIALAADENYTFKIRIEVTSPVEGTTEDIIVTAVSTFAAEDPPSSSVTFAVASDGQACDFPFAETFPDIDPDPLKWQDTCAILVTNETSHSTEYSIELAGGLPVPPWCSGQYHRLISGYIDLADQTAAYVHFWYLPGQADGPGDPPELGDDLILEYANDQGEWAGLDTIFADGAVMQEFEESGFIPLPQDGLHNHFKIRFRCLGVFCSPPDINNPESGYDHWFLDDITVGPLPLSSAPVLALPDSGDVLETPRPYLRWYHQDSAVYYQVLIGDDQDVINPLWTGETADIMWQVPEALSDNITYYWMVTSSADYLNWSGTWSLIWEFTKIPESTCPMLFISTADGYKIDNNVLSASEDSAQIPGFLSEYHLLRVDPALDENRHVHLELREDDHQITTLDGMKLAVAWVDEGQDVGMSDRGDVFYPVPVCLPVTARDALDNDVRIQLDDKDGDAFTSDLPGELVVNFGQVVESSVSASALWEEPGGGGFPPPGKILDRISPLVDVSGGNILRIDVRDENDEWMNVGIIPPQKIADMQYFQLSDWAKPGEDLWVRLRWDYKYSIDYLAYYEFETEGITRESLPLFDASHSVFGDIQKAVVESGDGSTTTLSPGEVISLSFGPVPEAPPSKVAKYILTSTGRYETIKELTDDDVVSDSTSLDQNSPNPFNEGTMISYSIARDAQVKIEIFDILGRRVTTLVNGFQPAGRQAIRWDGRDHNGKSVASGIYFYRLTAEDFTASKKMMLVK